MDPPPPQSNGTLKRSDSISQVSESSQTAQDYIASQLSLEADAREALPYQFDTCTQPLGPLRQSVYACLTCTPPPASKHQQFTPAGVCYSCSISCHGEHNLVELFTKRNFVCDCGTTRFSNSGTPCSLRPNPVTGRKGGVTGEPAREGNKYNQNFQGTFCGCGEEYDPEKEKGTMFQCLGLGTVEEGGCGEDWWHPECLMGFPRKRPEDTPKAQSNGALETVKEETEEGVQPQDPEPQVNTVVPEEHPPPEGFPSEDDFDHLICYKCTNAFPWVKQYAGTSGFLSTKRVDGAEDIKIDTTTNDATAVAESKKRKADDDIEDEQDIKKIKSEDDLSKTETPASHDDVSKAEIKADVKEQAKEESTAPIHTTLPPATTGDVALYVSSDFRDRLCRCPECFPRLAKHPQLLEEEESYEPPISESEEDGNENGSIAGRSVHSGSLLDRGEAALSSMDRVRAIEGVMAYNHVRDKVKAFLQPFAESGQPVGAEDIKAYFAKLRGDEQASRASAVQAEGSGEVDHRREQGGY